MEQANAGKAAMPWWRAWWAYLVRLEEAMDYSTTDYLLDRIKLLEGRIQDMRAELDAMKATGVER